MMRYVEWVNGLRDPLPELRHPRHPLRPRNVGTGHPVEHRARPENRHLPALRP